MSTNKEQLEIMFCESCNAEHKTATLLLSDLANQVYCDDCYYKNHILCNRCIVECRHADALLYHGNHVCRACYDTYFVNCYHCNETVDRGVVVFAMDHYYCQECFDEHIIYCESCDVHLYHDDSYTDEQSGDTLCEACYGEVTKDNNAIIKDYEFVPSMIYYTNGTTSHFEATNARNCYLGIELEVENYEGKCSNDEMAAQIYDLMKTKDGNDIVYFKHDGSLENGFEIITHPCSFEYLVSIRTKINKMLRLLINNGFVSWDSKNCGMHVHISINFLKQAGYVRMMDFFNQHRDFIKAISFRNSEQFQQWCKHLDGNFVDRCKQNIKNKRRAQSFGKYSALNLKDTTCEIRIFKGTLLKKSFWRNIEFAASVAEFSAIGKRSYFKYLFDNSKRFKNLCDEYNKRGWKKYQKKLVY